MIVISDIEIMAIVGILAKSVYLFMQLNPIHFVIIQTYFHILKRFLVDFLSSEYQIQTLLISIL